MRLEIARLAGPLVTAFGSASLSALSLAFIAERQPHHCNCIATGKRTGMIGAGLFLSSMFLSAAAETFEAQTAMAGTLVAVVLRLPVLFCGLDRSWAEGRSAPMLHTGAIILSWLGVSMIEWGTPRPRRGLSAGLSGLWSGRNGGYRGPFLVYFVSWIAGLLVAWRALRVDVKLTVLPAGLIRCMILAFICGCLWPMADTALAVGLATTLERSVLSGIFTIVFGLVVALILLRCVWECLQLLHFPLSVFVALVYSGATLIQVIQSHLLFHDLSWHPPGDSLISVDSPSASTLALGCVLVMLAIPALLKLLADFSESSYDLIASSAPGEAPDSTALQSSSEDHPSVSGSVRVAFSKTARIFADARITHRLLMWCIALLIICNVVGYVLGMTQPLIMLDIPGSDPKTTQKHTKSNLELLSILYSERMPCAAITILICTVLIPCVKFGATILAVCRPRFLPDGVHQMIQRILSMMSPYQFVDIFLVLLMLAYLNRSMHICKLMPGFSWFLMFCATSVILAQLVEVEPVLFPASGAGGSPIDDATNEAPAIRTRADVARALEGLWNTLGTLLIFFGAWVLFWLALITTPIPPLMIQARVMGIIVFVQQPTVLELYDGLCRQSLAFARFAVSVLIGIPMAHTAVAMVRTLQEMQSLDPKSVGRLTSRITKVASAKQLWLIEQLLKPWVMGDAAAIALSGLFLSIQEPSENFVLLLAQLPTVPVGFWAFLGMGVASCGLRLSPPGLSMRPHMEGFVVRDDAIKEISGRVDEQSQARATPADQSTSLLGEAKPELDDYLGMPAAPTDHSSLLSEEAKPEKEHDRCKPEVDDEPGKPREEEVSKSVQNFVEPTVQAVDVAAEESRMSMEEARGTSKAEARTVSAGKATGPTEAMKIRQADENSRAGRLGRNMPETPMLTTALLVTVVQHRVPWNSLAVWILWATLLWQFGPERPLTIHNMSELNKALHHIVPNLNSQLHRMLPPIIGSCGKLKNQRGEEAAKDTADKGAANLGLNCTDEQAVSVISLPGLFPGEHLKCRILWVEGLNSLTFGEMALFPSQNLPVPGPFGKTSWVLRVSGHFSGLQVWATASQVHGGQTDDVTDGYICCENPYHFMFQIAAECSMQKQGFDGKIDVQKLHMDPITLSLFVGGSHAMLTMDLGKFTDTIASDIRDRLGHFLSQLSGGTGKKNTTLPATPFPFKIVEVLNTIMQYNGWHACSA